jgi:hypothetical protein
MTFISTEKHGEELPLKLVTGSVNTMKNSESIIRQQDRSPVLTTKQAAVKNHIIASCIISS